MGEVYRARDSRLAREVAIKVLPADYSADPDRLRRFEQEARAAAATNHPNILAVYDVGTHDGAPYIVSELLEGETLRARLANGRVPRAIDYATQLARGLAAAHDKGVVHRDLKPENVFLTTDGQVKILDFGLAKLAQTPPLGGLSAVVTSPADTVPGTVLGTIGYMAPEQVRGQAADHRADIFAIGAIVYEMLSGERAFAAATTADTISAILNGEPPELPAASRHIPPGLVRIITRCLEKTPPARFQSTHDLAFALEALEPSSTHSTVIEPAVQTRHARLWLLLAGAMLLGIGLAAGLYLRRPPPTALLTRLDVVTPTTTNAFGFALSPDGRFLAFLAEREGELLIWIRPFDQAEARPLAGTRNADFPFWSPDGKAVGFFADGKLKRIDLAGGAPQVLADAPSGRGGTWSRDGVILFAPAYNGGLQRVDASGGSPSDVTRLADGQSSHRFPQFLPDGRRFVFFGISEQRLEARGTHLGSLDGGEPARVLASNAPALYAPPGFLLQVSDGVLMAHRFDADSRSVTQPPMPIEPSGGADPQTFRAAVSVSERGVLAYRNRVLPRRQPVWADRTGKTTQIAAVPDLTFSPGFGFELDPDGQRIASTQVVEQNSDVWITDIVRGITSRFTVDTALDTRPIWSHDGRRLVYSSFRGGALDLFQKPVNGSEDEKPIVLPGGDKTALDWSSDGRFLLYSVQDPKTHADLWALLLTGTDEPKPFPVAQTSFAEGQGRFSPDMRWVAYTANETGNTEVYVRSFPGPGGKWQVSKGGGLAPQWRRDSQELYYLTPDSHLIAVPIGVAPDGRTLAPGTAIELFQTKLGGSTEYAVGRDGRFLMTIATQDASPITVVLNWEAALQTN